MSESRNLEDITVPDCYTVKENQVDIVSQTILNGVKKEYLTSEEEISDEEQVLEYIKDEIVSKQVRIKNSSEASVVVSSNNNVLIDDEVALKVKDRIEKQT